MKTRWNLSGDASLGFDTRKLDKLSLTYTTPRFAGSAEFTGFPVLTVWLEASVPDPDLFVYLSVVDADGKTTLMTDGALRAVNRTLREPPWPANGIPWQGNFKDDVAPLPAGVPTKLEFALQPTSFYVKKGQRIRLTINGFDKGNFDTPADRDPPALRIFRDADHPSNLRLSTRPLKK